MSFYNNTSHNQNNNNYYPQSNHGNSNGYPYGGSSNSNNIVNNDGYDGRTFPTSNTNNGYSNNTNRYDDMASGYSNYTNDAYPPYKTSPPNPYSTPFDDPPQSSYPPAPITMNRSLTQYGPKSPVYPPPRSSTFPQLPSNSNPINNQSPVVVSKPLYDKSDPNAPRPPSQYGVKQESFYDKEYGNAGNGNYKEKPKYGGFMGTFCCCFPGGGCGKMCAILCCLAVLAVIIVAIVVLLWAKPPNVEFLGITDSPNNLPEYTMTANGFDFNFGLNISVDNPNMVGADFKSIKATAFYPNHTTPIGGGNLTDVHIAAKANTTIDFPFSINYDSSQDPGLTIVQDILSKCGIFGGQKQKITIDYTLVVSLKVLATTVSPSFSKSADFDCPIKNNQLPNIAGLNINNAINTAASVFIHIYTIDNSTFYFSSS
ncbi:9750_t:CDS:2 [Ambispora leptoticha]|uniref:9750_t:CDS:1 n=1 Tax=Ambispora leptoticha TaxID=144679 RepID=A0A9N8Z2D9_9GLOM|nr:9750_t:CDS:2 [Ambispora leptoticha]